MKLRNARGQQLGRALCVPSLERLGRRRNSGLDDLSEG
jgi:hypothetical protein